MAGAIERTIYRGVRRELQGTKKFIPLLLHRLNPRIIWLHLAYVGSLSIVVSILGLRVLVIHCRYLTSNKYKQIIKLSN